MFKLLVNTPADAQDVFEVGEGGGYFDLSRVLWDERTDGPMPIITLGGMVRAGNSLVLDVAMLAATAAAAVESKAQSALLKIDADTDAIYGAVLGNRAEEYTGAANDALAYQAAGYTGAVPASVQSWATAKSWTAQQAADNILATAAQWTGAQSAIRAERLLRKEQVRAATDATGVAAVMATWAGFVAYMRGQLGVA